MNKKSGSLLSRRQFARRAAVLSATATIAPAALTNSPFLLGVHAE